ncbi:MAG: LuxR C-terminal-related transcriptional regulator [Treponema sp.]|jgi:LuxR family maltose regulon positive regulatory protein|nr:LuxR C-terminal-related transcriptional regulator [Treponema sp.]
MKESLAFQDNSKKDDCIETTRNENYASFHFERPRLNNLFTEAVKYPVVVVCAGAGYGKTSAVHDFAEEYQAITAWVQLSERDNVGARFWENFTHALTQVKTPLARAIGKLDFPDTRDKRNQYLTLLHSHTVIKRQIIVLDDFHYIEDISVIRFVEECVLHKMPPGTSVFLVSRSTPHINIAALVSRGHIININENDLRFTENELTQYFRRMNISLRLDSFREIMKDTEGWAFAINLIARSYQKAPGYGGYLRSAMKTNIFRLMESEIWDGIPGHLQNFLVRLSLIDHLSADLIALLAGGNENLISDLERQSAYIRHDSYINAYLIHPMFLEFLSAKHVLLSEDQKRETYSIAGNWCNKNGFKIDAMSYFEKTGDYQSIVSVFSTLPLQIPYDIAKYAAAIFEKAPADAFDKVDLLAESHLRSYISQGLWEKSMELAKHYEANLLKLPKDDPFKNYNLSRLYFSWGYLRGFMCTTNDQYDFDFYFEKFCKYHPTSTNPGKYVNYMPGPWINCTGSSRKGAPEEYIKSLTNMEAVTSRYFNGLKTGKDRLAKGELLFYQGELYKAEPFITNAIKLIKDANIKHRALLYILRIGISQGNYQKAERALKEIKVLLEESEFSNRFINYDVSLGWYGCILGIPENIPDWLKENFSPYGHAGFIENFANQMKARFHYMARNYPPLLSYIQEMKQRESFLYGRVEMLAMEACIHYKMKDKKKAFISLLEAYETASPNGLIMPFIELGKDIRTLTTVAQKETDIKVPGSWLETINRKAGSYAKRRAHVIAEYKRGKGIVDGVAISPREAEILKDLSHGLSRVEIATSSNLSVNTVKMVINSLYTKLGAENLADLIRIATERKII